jgi:hypothetical protein
VCRVSYRYCSAENDISIPRISQTWEITLAGGQYHQFRYGLQPKLMYIYIYIYIYVCVCVCVCTYIIRICIKHLVFI